MERMLAFVSEELEKTIEQLLERHDILSNQKRKYILKLDEYNNDKSILRSICGEVEKKENLTTTLSDYIQYTHQRIETLENRSARIEEVIADLETDIEKLEKEIEGKIIALALVVGENNAKSRKRRILESLTKKVGGTLLEKIVTDISLKYGISLAFL